MQFAPNFYSLSHFVAAVVSLSVALLFLLRRRTSAEKYLGFGMLAGAWWAVVSGIETGIRDESLKYLLAGLRYVGAYSVTPFLVIFALKYARMDRLITRRNLILLWILPVAIMFLALTNPYHHLIWVGIQTINASEGLYRFWPGPLFWLGVCFIYCGLLLVSFLLLRKTLRSHIRLYRNQAMIVLLGMLPPWLINFLHFFQISIFHGTDLTPHAFALTGIVMTVGILRYRFTDLTPIARSLVFLKLSDGILVLNRHLVVTDANEASEHILGLSLGDLVGQPAKRVLAEFPAQLTNLHRLGKVHLEALKLLPDGKEHCFDIEAINFSDSGENLLGYMVQFRDITDRKRIEVQEHDQRLLAQAMQNIALTITATFDIEKVLETVADNMYRTIPCLLCSILLQGEDGRLHLASCRGMPHAELRKWLDEGLISTAATAHYKLMAETGQAMVISDVTRSASWVTLDPRVRSWTAAPIRIMGEVIGFLSFDHDQAGFYSEVHAQRLKSFADLSAIIIKHARMYHENELLANTDPLTGLSNRRHFFGLAENELIRTRRYGGPLSMLMIDLDHLKEINDRCGHHIGDRAIVETAQTLCASLRDHDLCARFGGDEFCILLPSTDSHGALETAKRLVEEAHAISLGTDSCTISFSLSIGVAALQDKHLTVDDLLVDADRALYRAKQIRNHATI